MQFFSIHLPANKQAFKQKHDTKKPRQGNTQKNESTKTLNFALVSFLFLFYYLFFFSIPFARVCAWEQQKWHSNEEKEEEEGKKRDTN